MAKTKGITGCTILKPLTPEAAMRAVCLLNEMALKDAGKTADMTPRLRRPGETGTAVLAGKSQEEAG